MILWLQERKNPQSTDRWIGEKIARVAQSGAGRVGHVTVGSDTGSTEIVGAVRSEIAAGTGLTEDTARSPELRVEDASLLDKDIGRGVLMQKKRVIYSDNCSWGCCSQNPCGEEADASLSSESLWGCKSRASDPLCS
jgi:hypothetical protein